MKAQAGLLAMDVRPDDLEARLTPSMCSPVASHLLGDRIDNDIVLARALGRVATARYRPARRERPVAI